MPDELHDVIQAALDKHVRTIQYSRIDMPLSALLEESFFNVYIKSGITSLYFPLNQETLALILESVLTVARENCDVVRRSSWHRLHVLAS